MLVGIGMTAPAGTQETRGLSEERSTATHPTTPFETAQYIFKMAVELRGLASGAGLDMLALILDMAAEEAEERARGPGGH